MLLRLMQVPLLLLLQKAICLPVAAHEKNKNGRYFIIKKNHHPRDMGLRARVHGHACVYEWVCVSVFYINIYVNMTAYNKTPFDRVKQLYPFCFVSHEKVSTLFTPF